MDAARSWSRRSGPFCGRSQAESLIKVHDLALTRCPRALPLVALDCHADIARAIRLACYSQVAPAEHTGQSPADRQSPRLVPDRWLPAYPLPIDGWMRTIDDGLPQPYKSITARLGRASLAEIN